MPVHYQGPLRPTPTATTVDGPLTLSVDVLVSDDLDQLDVEYTITNSNSAVFFQDGTKTERRKVSVSASQVTLVNRTRLRCGPGEQRHGTTIAISISSGGVPQANPISCGVAISSFTCAPIDEKASAPADCVPTETVENAGGDQGSRNEASAAPAGDSSAVGATAVSGGNVFTREPGGRK